MLITVDQRTFLCEVFNALPEESIYAVLTIEIIAGPGATSGSTKTDIIADWLSDSIFRLDSK